MSNKSPSITVIVAVLNGAKTLQQCIDSVARQTLASKELIIVDGGSTDGTQDIIRANQEKISCWISEPDTGVYSAWNKALHLACGEWICFLGADDYLWSNEALELVDAVLDNVSPNVNLAYSQIMLLGIDAKVFYPIGDSWGARTRRRFMQGRCLPHQGVMHRRRMFEQNGLFDESFKIAGDYELLYRELKTSEAFFVSGVILTGMRQGGLCSRLSNSVVVMREIRRAQKMNGKHLPGFYWMVAITRAYLRLLLLNIAGEKAAGKILNFIRKIWGLAPYWDTSGTGRHPS